jgi:organic radical activating enzyme
VRQVVTKVDALAAGSKLVCITGGEPLMQITDLREFVDALKFRDYQIEVFTNSTLLPPAALFHAVDTWVVDIKCPASGVSSLCRSKQWLGMLRSVDMVKFVVETTTDLDYVTKTLRSCSTAAAVCISPCITVDLLNDEAVGGLSLQSTRPWLQTVWSYCVAHNYQFGLQTHKIVYGNKKGV